MKVIANIFDHIKNTGGSHSLLLGNGFSMAYDSATFSSNALHDCVVQADNQILTELFKASGHKNFELIMQELNSFKILADILGMDEDSIDKLSLASDKLKTSLIDAVKSVHPENAFSIEKEKKASCLRFLQPFLESGSVFTTNYDLLLYWVFLKGDLKKIKDGFGRQQYSFDESSPEYSELHWGPNKDKQNIFFLHGALHLFDMGEGILKESSSELKGITIVEKIRERIDKNQYPIFVSAGSSKEKITQIRHNNYLSFCYDKLSEVKGSLVIFGFNFGEYDNHIIEAINQAAKGKADSPKLDKVYIGVYSDEGKRDIESKIGRFECNVELFDSKSIAVW